MGAPYEMNGPYQTGDVYKCSLNSNKHSCSKLNLGRVSTTEPLWKTFVKQHCIGVSLCVRPSDHMSVNSLVECGRLKCEDHTNHSTFYYSLYIFPYVCPTTHPTTRFFIWAAHVLCWLGRLQKLCQVNV